MSLILIMVRKLNVVQGMTCYDAHRIHNVACRREACSKWINNAASNNCVVIATQKGPHTLNEIGKIYGLSRMRICQLEKKIYTKLKLLLKQ
jgi:hypothetical protein